MMLIILETCTTYDTSHCQPLIDFVGIVTHNSITNVMETRHSGSTERRSDIFSADNLSLTLEV